VDPEAPHRTGKATGENKLNLKKLRSCSREEGGAAGVLRGGEE
jgi:hypothetical protein